MNKISNKLLGDLPISISPSMVLRIKGVVALVFILCTLEDVSTEDTLSEDRSEEMEDSDMDNDIIKGTEDSEMGTLESNAKLAPIT